MGGALVASVNEHLGEILNVDFAGVTPYRPRLAVVLATIFCSVAVLPAIPATLIAGATIMSLLTGAGATLNQALQVSVVLAVFIAALVAFVMMRRSITARRTWVWAGLSIILVAAASAPVVWVASQNFIEEWCEYQPGGRGNADTGSLDEIPAVCR
ncbi:hypothetical protein [Arthrobacter sp. OY3WO11]|uniref:hypothetical protein n=1 Tax=Arthrobacter sp. OY3WO11 TaxID=1835723 RepID=UPI0012E7E165|nr:hypothetical protein [Arthrobacter sp. OY3WO11]